MTVRKILTLLLALAGACSGAPDDDAAAIYDQPFMSDGCRADGDYGSDHWLTTVGSLPSTGTWRVTWRCVSDCRGTNAPPLTTADAVDITSGTMRFRRGATVIEELPQSTTANCRIAPPSSAPGCRSAIRVCGSSRCQGGGACAEVTYAAWGQESSGVGHVTAYEAIVTR